MVVVAAALAAATTLFGAGNAWADPPTRVARLSYVSGAVSFSPAGDDQWAQAVLNRPLVTGDRLWSDAGARGELAFDNGVLWLGAATSLVVSNMDDSTAQFELQQGVLDLRVRQLPQGAVVEVDTPNLAFQVTRPGRYRLVVDPQGGTTSVIVKNGAAAVYGEQASYAIAGGESYRFAGTDLQDGGPVAIEAGAEFERFADERDGRFARVVSARYVSPEVVGYEDLDQYGTWQPNPEYGNVWYPREIPSGWAPYHNGHWSWIDPWGWTWVDEAPWGFAPFHYGRWAYVSNRWGWVPGPVNVRPVYAPALVAFVGGAGFSVALSSGPAIGWFPLGPREVYRPAYNVSREYYRQVNVSNTVINNTVINNTYVSNVTNTTAPAQPRASYRNLQAPNAVTAVAPTAFAQGQRVDRVAVKMPANTLNDAQIQPLAKVAPARTAFVGDAPAARTTPPATTQQRAVIAKVAPPPAVAPIAQRMTTLERDPGKPLDRAQMQAGRPAGSPAATERNVKVVNAAKAPVAPPPIAQRDNARAGKGAPAATPGSPPGETPAAKGTQARRGRQGPGRADATHGNRASGARRPRAGAATRRHHAPTRGHAGAAARRQREDDDIARTECARRRIRHEGCATACRRAGRAADEHAAAATRGRAACRAARAAAPGAAFASATATSGRSGRGSAGTSCRGAAGGASAASTRGAAGGTAASSATQPQPQRVAPPVAPPPQAQPQPQPQRVAPPVAPPPQAQPQPQPQRVAPPVAPPPQAQPQPQPQRVARPPQAQPQPQAQPAPKGGEPKGEPKREKSKEEKDKEKDKQG